MLACAALPLALGSFWALAPVSLLVASGLCRVGLEDRFLATNLTGYPEYAARVRYRLVPGIW